MATRQEHALKNSRKIADKTEKKNIKLHYWNVQR